MKPTVRAMCAAAMMTVLLAVGAWLTVPVSPPFTMQTFVLYLCAWLFGRKKATAAVALYLALGAVGVPVFSGFGGGIGVLIGPTGGYLLGFLAIALIGGDRGPWWRRALLAGSGTLCCYTIGTLWYAGVYTGFSAAGLGAAVLSCVVPFILPDAVKMALAAVVCRRAEVSLSRLL